MPQRTRAAIFLLIALLFACGSGTAVAAEPSTTGPGNVQVDIRNGLLTLDAHGAPLETVLNAIGKEATFDVVIDADLDSSVNRSFSGLPVDQSLRRLLDGASFVMVYSGSGDAKRLTLLHVYAGAGTAGVKAVRPQVTTVEESLQADMEGWIRTRLESTDRGTRIVAVRRLTQLESEVAVGIAAQVLEYDDDPIVRGQAAATLGKLAGNGASRVLEAALADDVPSVRMHAVKALGAVRDEYATKVLGQVLLQHRDAQMRLAAARELAGIATETSERFLKAATLDKDAEVRHVAEEAVERSKRLKSSG